MPGDLSCGARPSLRLYGFASGDNTVALGNGHTHNGLKPEGSEPLSMRPFGVRPSLSLPFGGVAQALDTRQYSA